MVVYRECDVERSSEAAMGGEEEARSAQFCVLMMGSCSAANIYSGRQLICRSQHTQDQVQLRMQQRLQAFRVQVRVSGIHSFNNC
jgi:hypothetical protein